MIDGRLVPSLYLLYREAGSGKVRAMLRVVDAEPNTFLVIPEATAVPSPRAEVAHVSG